MSSSVRRPLLALVGDQYNHEEPSHPRIESLLPALGVDTRWMPTREITDTTSFTEFDGIWVVPGAPYHAQQGVHRAIRFAREHKVPFLGTCGGFYSAVLEYAQNVLRLAETAELKDDLGPIEPLIIPPTCTADNNNRVPLFLRQGSFLSALYDHRTEVEEILQCDYGMVREFLDAASQGDVRFSGWDDRDAPRALEISDHPFFVACLYQPELSSTPDTLHPLLAGFVSAVRDVAGVPQTASHSAPFDVESYESALDCVRNGLRTRTAFTAGSSFSQIEVGPGLRAVRRVSGDGDVHLLCVHNITGQSRTFSPVMHLAPARDEGAPVRFVSGAMETLATENDEMVCEVRPGAVVWLGCVPATVADTTTPELTGSSLL